MEDYYVIFTIIALIFAVLQIILFIKLWNMTDDFRKVKLKILDFLESQEPPLSAEDIKAQKQQDDIDFRKRKKRDDIISIIVVVVFVIVAALSFVI